MIGLVSEYEEREAAVFTLHPWAMWLELPLHERAACVAHMRLHNIVSRHVEDAVQREVERRQKRKQK